MEQHNPLSDKAKVLLPDQGLQPCWRVQDVQPPALPMAGGPGPSEALQRSVSSNIDVPKRFVPLAGGISGGSGVLGSFASAHASFYTDRTAMLGIYPLPSAGLSGGWFNLGLRGFLICFFLHVGSKHPSQ